LVQFKPIEYFKRDKVVEDLSQFHFGSIQTNEKRKEKKY